MGSFQFVIVIIRRQYCVRGDVDTGMSFPMIMEFSLKKLRQVRRKILKLFYKSLVHETQPISWLFMTRLGHL